jgi:hypothetical protein
VDVFLDETTRGLRGNLALVAQGPPLTELAGVETAIRSLAGAASAHLPERYRTPITLRLRLAGPDRAPEEAETELRFKILIPKAAVDAGAAAVADLAEAAVGAFERLADDPAMEPFRE